MRILANSEHLSPNTGISVQTLEVTEDLAKRGHQIDLLYMRDGPYRERYQQFCHSMDEIPLLDLGVHHALRDGPKLVPAVRQGIRDHPDVIYVNRYRPLPWALSVGALTRSPVVCHMHGLIGAEHPMVNWSLGRVTTRFICVSNFVRDRFLALGGRADRTDVIHNGIDPAAYPVGGDDERRSARAELGLPPDRTLVMFYGRIDPSKGIDVLVDSLAGLGTTGRPVELVVVGSAHDDEWADRILDSCAVPVHRLTMRTDVVTPLHASDVVVVPSVYDDPFPRTVIEAMCTGRPVIATTTGGIPEALTGQFAAMLVPPGDPVALTAKLVEVLDWRDERPELGAQCADHVAQNFSMRSMVDAIEQRLVDAAG